MRRAAWREIGWFRHRPDTGSDTAARASIGAAAREVKLSTVRADAARLAEIAVRKRQNHLAYLAEILTAEMTAGTAAAPPHQ